MSIDNGGPAFPQDQNVARTWAIYENAKKPLSEEDYIALIESLQVGMSLRDYFAAKAMEARVITYPTMAESDVAEYSYRMADAMLKARNK